jgi:hypothetical protein
MAKWMSKLPEVCEVCGKPFGVYFYDAAIDGKAWGLVCDDCWKKHNGKVAYGSSQKYITATQECIGGMEEVEC